MENSKTVSMGGISTTLLFIAFLVLKLVGVIDWSWWWITAPIWISAAFVIIFIIVLLALK